MKKTIIATAVAFALSGTFAFAQSDQSRYEHGSKYEHGSRMSEQPGGITGWAYRTHGNNAELGGDNANSGSGENSAADGAFSSSG
jgi:hypothetical protein